ncbi:MAG: deoxyribonuclease IV [Pseudomonadota bacterium]|jgi:deoxyribonuclease-4
MKHFIGAHVSCAGGLANAARAAIQLDINTIQIHPSPPQRWNSQPFAPGVEDEFNSLRKDSCLEKVFFHAIYLINMATPDAQKFHLAKTSLLNYLDLCARINGAGVIFHVGSMKDQPNEDEGYDRVVSGLNWILERAPKNARLIMEVAAGSGSIIGDQVEELALIYSQLERKDLVGFGLDTQHMWASGYDLVNDLDGVVKLIDKEMSLDKVWSIHLNDSKTECGSKKDRHENIGDGLIGSSALAKVVTHPKLQGIPFILETPALESLEGARSEVDKVIAFLG